VNVQQFNKDFIKEWFGTTKGTPASGVSRPTA